jgi:predicted Rossmann-fold nucleotide-binding protein
MRRLVLLNTQGFFDPFVAQLERGVDEGFDDEAVRQYVSVTDDPEIAVSRCFR